MTDVLDRAVDAALDSMPKPTQRTPTRQHNPDRTNGGPALDELIRRGERSPNARTRRAAERARRAVDALRTALETEQAEAEAADAVTALERQLEEAKAELRRIRRGHTTPSVPPGSEPPAMPEKQLPRTAPGRRPTAVPTRKYQAGVDYIASTVRAWARENGWAHPLKGRFCPPALVAQYLTDTGGEP